MALEEKVEFKEDAVHNDRLAMEIAAFANFKGGVILLGVSDSGEIKGLTRRRNEERVMSICSSSIEPRIIPEYEHVVINGKRIAVITVDIGREKPYAVLKQGRRQYFIRVGSIVRESTQRELMRMFQDSARLHAEVLPTIAGFAALDHRLIRDHFSNFRSIHLKAFDEDAYKRALINSAIMDEDGRLTIAGCLLFAGAPARFFGGAGVSFAVIDGDDPVDPLREVKSFDGPMFDCLDKVFGLFKLHNRSIVSGIGETGRRVEVHSYPIIILNFHA